MSKILKPYTIIPQDLYVQRDADRQVKNIIADMGRPGCSRIKADGENKSVTKCKKETGRAE